MTPEDPFAIIARHLADHDRRAGQSVSSYAALGDSFTAGTGCEPEDRWADRLARGLRGRNPSLTYGNLAAHGATSEEVLEQVGPALQLEPDLVTVICGANDVLRSVRPDIDGYAHRLAEIFDRLRSALPRVAILTATSPESWSFLELGPRTESRVSNGIRNLNRATRSVSASRGVPCVDVADHPGLDDATNFSADGLHPSAAGHERAARELAAALHEHFGIDSGITWKEHG